MAKKNLARARLVKLARWVVEWFEVLPDGSTKRHRKEFGLNDIDDLTVREAVGLRIAENLHSFIVERPDPPTLAEKAGPTVSEAVAVALARKLKSPRRNTHRGYKSISKKFLLWAAQERFDTLPVLEFSRRHARAFFDHLTDSRAYRGCTINNYLTHLKALWSELIDRELATANPFKSIKPVREETKLRRIFTDEERRVVAAEIEQTDYWLFRGLLLQFFCYVRPVELTRLRFRDFDLGRGLVTVQEGDAKSWKKVVKTIPRSILPYFIDGRFNRYPANFFMLGRVEDRRGMARVEPCTTPVDDDRMYRRHLKVLTRLKKQGKIGDFEGLTWYSWKDTGISLHTRRTSPTATKDQAGHTDLTTTSLYYHAPDVIAEYRDLPNDLWA